VDPTMTLLLIRDPSSHALCRSEKGLAAVTPDCRVDPVKGGYAELSMKRKARATLRASSGGFR